MQAIPNSCSRPRALGLFSALVLAIALGPQAEAGFEVGNLSTNNGFDPTSGFNLTGPQTSTGQGYAIGVRFTVAATTSVAFNSLELGLAYRNGTNKIDVSLMTDGIGGIPGGTTLETIHLADISAVPSLVTATSTVHSVLDAGASYWIVAVYGSANTSVSWLGNNSGQVGHSAYRPDISSGIGSWTAGPSFDDPSFALFGDAITGAGTAVVDAPPSGVLVGIGCLGLASGWFHGRGRRDQSLINR